MWHVEEQEMRQVETEKKTLKIYILEVLFNILEIKIEEDKLNQVRRNTLQVQFQFKLSNKNKGYKQIIQTSEILIIISFFLINFCLPHPTPFTRSKLGTFNHDISTNHSLNFHGNLHLSNFCQNFPFSTFHRNLQLSKLLSKSAFLPSYLEHKSLSSHLIFLPMVNVESLFLHYLE